MRPAQAIKTGLAKSFQFKGRASRTEFWWFAPVALGLAIASVWILLPRVIAIAWFTKFIIAFLALTPLWACGARRLQDTGEEGRDIFLPASIFFGVPLAIAIAVFVATAANGLLGIFLLLFVALPVIGFGLLATFTSLGPTIGQLIVSSEPGTNRFGPNPNEVPS